MKAIYTKYLPATNTRGSRIVATAEGGKRPHRVSIPYPHELSGMDVYAEAAKALMKKMGWKGKLAGGGLPDGGYAFVFTGDKSEQYEVNPAALTKLDYKTGERVQLHPGTDAWMRGDKYGVIVKVGAKFIHVKMDRSGRTLRVSPRNIYEHIGTNPAPRIGTRNSTRRSQATGRAPSRRLVRRRRRNTAKGFFPNPSQAATLQSLAYGNPMKKRRRRKTRKTRTVRRARRSRVAVPSQFAGLPFLLKVNGVIVAGFRDKKRAIQYGRKVARHERKPVALMKR